MLPFTVSTRTDTFRRAELSEDRLAVHHVPGGLVVVVADGAGGIPGAAPRSGSSPKRSTFAQVGRAPPRGPRTPSRPQSG